MCFMVSSPDWVSTSSSIAAGKLELVNNSLKLDLESYGTNETLFGVLQHSECLKTNS